MAKRTGTADVVSWEAEPQATPVADIETLREGLEDIGQPVEEWVEELNRRRLSPLVCDLSGDPLCCAILRQLARHPWEPAHRCALLDRMEELGYDNRLAMAQFVVAGLQRLLEAFVNPPQSWSRRGRRWIINECRRKLRTAFGPYE